MPMLIVNQNLTVSHNVINCSMFNETLTKTTYFIVHMPHAIFMKTYN